MKTEEVVKCEMNKSEEVPLQRYEESPLCVAFFVSTATILLGIQERKS
jgi:hypothetical protein